MTQAPAQPGAAQSDPGLQHRPAGDPDSQHVTVVHEAGSKTVLPEDAYGLYRFSDHPSAFGEGLQIIEQFGDVSGYLTVPDGKSRAKFFELLPQPGHRRQQPFRLRHPPGPRRLLLVRRPRPARPRHGAGAGGLLRPQRHAQKPSTRPATPLRPRTVTLQPHRPALNANAAKPNRVKSL